MQKRISILLVIVLSLSVFLTACGPSDDEILDGSTELVEAVNTALQNGQQELDFYVREMTEDDIYELNTFLDGFWGSSTQYAIDYEEDGVIGGTLELELSDNYYAYNSYINGDTIPEDRTQAKAVADKLPGIVEQVEKDSEYATELATHDYIILNTPYDETIAEESDLNTAYGALVEGTTMCNGYADAMALILECLEVDVRVIVGESQGEGHAWNLVELDDIWYHVDATWDDMDEGDMIFHGYFNVNDTDMANTHEWSADLFPAAEGQSYQYYTENGLYFESYDAFVPGIQNLLANNPSFAEAMVSGHIEDTYDYQFVFDSIDSDEISYYEETVGPNTVVLFNLQQ